HIARARSFSPAAPASAARSRSPFPGTPLLLPNTPASAVDSSELPSGAPRWLVRLPPMPARKHDWPVLEPMSTLSEDTGRLSWRDHSQNTPQVAACWVSPVADSGPAASSMVQLATGIAASARPAQAFILVISILLV